MQSTSTCCRFVFESLNRDVVSYMAVGIDLNYFFSWPLVLFIFATRLKGLKTQRHPTRFFTKRGYGTYVGGYLLSNVQTLGV